MSGSRPTADSSTPATAEPGLAVAVSGGADSMALLHACARAAEPLGLTVWAFHIHHGLQAVADEWPDFIAQECARWREEAGLQTAIELRVHRVRDKPGPGMSIEEWARQARYEALRLLARRSGVGRVLLAHHQQDQAETFLLQALRGAGPQGLAGMPALQHRGGVTWVRPWLHHPRDAIRAYVQTHGLRHIEDPSNQDMRFARNRLRHLVMPALDSGFDGWAQSLAQAARQCGRSLPSLDWGVQQDRAQCLDESEPRAGSVRLKADAWGALSLERRAGVLRAWLLDRASVRCGAPTIERLAQELGAHRVARWPLGQGWELRAYRGVLTLDRAGGLSVPAPTDAAAAAVAGSDRAPAEGDLPKRVVTFHRRGLKTVADWAGRLRLRQAQPGEAGLAGPLPLILHLRGRQPTDRFQFAPSSLARSLKKQYQAAGVPAWMRRGPMVCTADGRLLLVPGLGLDARQTVDGGRWVLEWLHDDPAPTP